MRYRRYPTEILFSFTCRRICDTVTALQNLMCIESSQWVYSELFVKILIKLVLIKGCLNIMWYGGVTVYISESWFLLKECSYLKKQKKKVHMVLTRYKGKEGGEIFIGDKSKTQNSRESYKNIKMMYIWIFWSTRCVNLWECTYISYGLLCVLGHEGNNEF